MVQIYNCMDALSHKCDEELFHIYCGHPKHRPKEERYLAARILESRDFKFKEIGQYQRKWEKDKWSHLNATQLKIKFTILNHQNKIISALLMVAFIFLVVFVLAPLLFKDGLQSFSFNGEIWFFLNILSFVVFFYIFGFIGYFSRFIGKLRKKKRVFEIYHQQTA